jgi:hypothetical protein
MAKVIVARMDVAALLKLRGEIDRQLSTRRQQLEKQLSHLGPTGWAGARAKGPGKFA